jgi:predicted extracellular nuclease
MKKSSLYLATRINHTSLPTNSKFQMNRAINDSASRKWFAYLVPMLALIMVAAIGLRVISAAGTPISLTAVGVAYTQDFNTLANSGTSSTVPTGWAFSETGTAANTTYTAGTGSGNTGDTYSFGAASNTERAFGGLQSGALVPTIGACFTNNTGGTVTSLVISYTGEQWRLGTTGRADRIDFQYSTNATSLTTGTWTDVDALDFSSLVTTGALGALDGNAAANRANISFTISSLTIANGTTFFIRWNDFNATGADDGLSVDDFSLTPMGNGGGGMPALTINNVTVPEGNSGATAATFTVSLSAPAGVGGVTFDIATQDGTATVADNDYVARTIIGQTIAEGSQNFSFAVTVNGDTNPEPNETFLVNITNVTGATLADDQGVGTITNDDFASIPIHTIQGSGTMSPFANQVVTVSGIVTGVKSNGFFIQAPDAEADANPSTSEGVFVFTSSAPPAAAAIGNSVAVMGTVQEFVPPSDLNSPPTTEIVTPTTNLLSTGNALPAAITITAADTSPTGAIGQLEKLEGMRVHVNSLTVIAPTQGNINESSATASTNGVFYGVITGIARPFREPGLEIPDPAPAGSPCCIPRFDANPERLRVDSDAQPGAIALEVTTGATVMNITGPLDFGFRTYTIVPDAATTPVTSGNISAIPVPIPNADEFTVGSFNLERFYDTTDDPGVSDVALTATAFNNRMNKASLAIRNVMRSPDILGIEEMENLSTFQSLANKINNDALAATGTNPNYQAFLVEGNDVGGIDVGFLVKTSRVSVIDVTQFGKNTTYISPNNGQPELLNDRPPLVLRATVTAPDSSSFAITVIVNHLRSLNGVDDPIDGNRIRTKRRAQAEFLANFIQARQMADPTERIVSVGDYNAFQFNDGYGDSIGTIKGTPTPPNEVVLASSDLVNPDLIDLLDYVPADQRYSFSFDGNAQVLDHELITSNLLPLFSRIAYARNNGDFPEIFRSDPNRPERISDHDMAVAYFKFAASPCSFTLSSTSQSFSGAGNDGNVGVITHAGCSWNAVSNDSWLMISSDDNGTGSGTITFTIRENLSMLSRIGTITIAGQVFTINQAGAGGDCTYTISPANKSFSTSGGSGTVNVSSMSGCGWTATSDAEWINITSGGSGVGDGIVNYSVTANSGAARSGKITIAGQVFTVKQKGS